MLTRQQCAGPQNRLVSVPAAATRDRRPAQTPIPCCAVWQPTLARMGVQNITLRDLVYIADSTFFNRPTKRLQVCWQRTKGLKTCVVVCEGRVLYLIRQAPQS